MKTLLLAVLVMILCSTTQATEVFNTTYECISLNKKSDVKVEIKEGDLREAILVVKLSVQEDPIHVKAKKVLPSRKNPKAPVKYTGKISSTGDKVEVALGARAIKIATLDAKISTINVAGRIENQVIACIPTVQ